LSARRQQIPVCDHRTLAQPVPYGATSAHGTRARYVAGCHCYRCRLANAAYQRRYMRRWRAARPAVSATVQVVWKEE
jgi:hypothetical protein